MMHIFSFATVIIYIWRSSGILLFSSSFGLLLLFFSSLFFSFFLNHSFSLLGFIQQLLSEILKNLLLKEFFTQLNKFLVVALIRILTCIVRSHFTGLDLWVEVHCLWCPLAISKDYPKWICFIILYPLNLLIVGCFLSLYFVVETSDLFKDCWLPNLILKDAFGHNWTLPEESAKGSFLV